MLSTCGGIAIVGHCCLRSVNLSVDQINQEAFQEGLSLQRLFLFVKITASIIEREVVNMTILALVLIFSARCVGNATKKEKA